VVGLDWGVAAVVSWLEASGVVCVAEVRGFSSQRETFVLVPRINPCRLARMVLRALLLRSSNAKNE